MPRRLTGIGLTLLLLSLTVFGSSAQTADGTLTNNNGTASTLWFISGEPSLVINGFDLNARNITLPIQVESITISVRTPTPGIPVEAVIYQDQDGGSPQNATLLARKSFDITTAGIFTAKFDTPVTVNRRFLWVGFYLPIDFEFRADTQGKSVLTYWGWTPGGTFDLNSLSTATVFGPGDGSAPVSITMNGVARIDANIISGGQNVTNPVNSPQIVGDPNTNLSVLTRYPVCAVRYDTGDLLVTYQDALDLDCKVVHGAYEPENPSGYAQRGPLYDIVIFGAASTGTVPIPYPITHCIEPNDNQVETGVLALAYGAPREWHILPTVRFGTTLCAEVSYSGFLSVFLPR